MTINGQSFDFILVRVVRLNHSLTNPSETYWNLMSINRVFFAALVELPDFGIDQWQPLTSLLVMFQQPSIDLLSLVEVLNLVPLID